jgi:Helix-turn-helix domain
LRYVSKGADRQRPVRGASLRAAGGINVSENTPPKTLPTVAGLAISCALAALQERDISIRKLFYRAGLSNLQLASRGVASPRRHTETFSNTQLKRRAIRHSDFTSPSGQTPATRRLSEKGTSFADVVDQLRQSLSLRYLKEPGLTLAQIAWRLGYERPIAFTHAFKRWTGRSSSVVRNENGRHLFTVPSHRRNSKARGKVAEPVRPLKIV